MARVIVPEQDKESEPNKEMKDIQGKILSLSDELGTLNQCFTEHDQWAYRGCWVYPDR